MAAPPMVGPEADSAQDAWTAPCRGVGDGSHRVHVVGYLRGPRPAGMVCEQPVRVVCRNPGCSASTAWRCSSHRESRCRACAEVYRRRLSRLAEYGMSTRDGQGHMGMLTVTAPSPEEHRRWAVRPTAHRDICSCQRHMVGGLGAWNASASRRWNHLRTLLTRDHPDLVFLRAVEVQKRGALHLHIIVWTPKPLVLQRVQELAMRSGFGCVLDFAPCAPGSRRAAYYVSKYVTKACDSRGVVPWTADVVDQETGEVQALDVVATYRTWSASRSWGITMAQIRAAAARAVAAHRAALEAATLGPPATATREGAPASVGDPPPD